MSDRASDRQWRAGSAPSMVSLSPRRREAVRSLWRKIETGEYELEAAACLCGSTRGRLVADHGRFGIPVTMRLCRRCGTLWQSPRLAPDSLRRFYQEDYRPIYVGPEATADAFFSGQLERGKSVYDFVLSVGVFDAAGTALDVGCGAGGVMAVFKEHGWQTAGCDPSVEMVELGRSKGLDLTLGEVDSMAPSPGADLVILRHVLEHIAAPRDFLSGVSALLRPDGFVYVGVPGVFHTFDVKGCQGRLEFNVRVPHLYGFTLKTLSCLMAECGFRLVKGTEEIDALYQKTPDAERVSCRGEAARVSTYCRLLRLERWARRSRVGSAVQKLVAALVRWLYRIDLHGPVPRRTRSSGGRRG